MLGLALLGCRRLESADEARGISFSVGGVLTKGAPYSTPFTESFGLFAYTYDQSAEVVPESSKVLDPNAYNLEVTYRSALGCWLPTTPLYWPNVETKDIQFFAYAPKSAVSSVSASSGHYPTISYTVPESVASQHGLLVANEVKCSAPLLSEMQVRLPFRHVLFALRFQCDLELTITNITVSGLYDSGVYNLGTQSWDSRNKLGHTYSIDSPGCIAVGDVKVLNDDYTMMLLPQTLESGAQVSIQFADEDTPRAFSIAGQTWRPGTVATYVIHRSEVYIIYGNFGEDVLWTDDGEW